MTIQRPGLIRMYSLAVIVVMVLAVGACGGSDQVVTSAADESSASTTLPSEVPALPDQVSVEWAPMPNWSIFALTTEALVIGEVVTISEPRTNDASPPSATGKGRGAPDRMVYRDVVVKVQDVVFDSDRVKVAEDVVTVRTMGDGTATGVLVSTPVGSRRMNELGGQFFVGDRLVLALFHWDYPFSDGRTEPVLGILTDFYGVWRLDGTSAVSTVPNRSLDVELLKGRFLEARAQPKDVTSRTGRDNPAEVSRAG